MPFSRARSATALPTAAAASLLPVYFSCSAIAFSTVKQLPELQNRSVQLPVRKCARGTMYHQASCAQLLELAACAGRTTDTSRFLIHSVTLLLLSLFGTHDFVGVTNTLAFIRLRTTVGAQIRCNLADHLLISAFQHDFSLSRTFSSDTRRQLMVNRMRNPETG